MPMRFQPSPAESQRRFGFTPASFFALATSTILPGMPMEQVTEFPDLDFSIGICENITYHAVASRDIHAFGSGFHVCVGCVRQYEQQQQQQQQDADEEDEAAEPEQESEPAERIECFDCGEYVTPGTGRVVNAAGHNLGEICVRCQQEP